MFDITVKKLKSKTGHVYGTASVNGVIVTEAELMFALTNRLHRGFNMDIHPTAIISAKANLAKGVQVGPYTVIEDNVTVGKADEIGSHCVTRPHDHRPRLRDLHRRGPRRQAPGYEIQGREIVPSDRRSYTIREYCFFDPGTGEGGKTVIGSHNLFMAMAHVAHDCIVGDHCIVVNGGTLGGHVVWKIMPWSAALPRCISLCASGNFDNRRLFQSGAGYPAFFDLRRPSGRYSGSIYGLRPVP